MTTSKLPADFLWGFATSSYQIEGAVAEDGRGPSIWDTFCKIPGKIADGTSGDVACDTYHHTAEDTALLKQYGAKVYRFSISWSRIIPLGGRNDPVNEKGLQFYVKFVDDLLAAGITPFITLFHWDLPEGLEKRYGGLLNKDEFVADFANYARVVFSALSGKVKHWITFNEPWCSAILGYNTGAFAPGRSSDRTKSTAGDSDTECWIVGHNLLVAHGAAVKVYRNEFKPLFGGEIGITLNGDWAEPWDPQNPADIAACEKKLEFFISWFGDPIYRGKYPESMVRQLGDRLPTWTPEDLALVHGSNDFYGMNTYCAHYIRSRPYPENYTVPPADFTGGVDILMQNKSGELIGPETDCDWLRPNPRCFRKLLKWISDRYDRPKIYVTENGTSVKGENDLPLEKLLDDEFRAWYFREYIAAMADAATLDDVNVRGYMAWSLLDNFEWADGYKIRFGLTYVDYKGGQKRIPKKSARVIGEIFRQYIQQ